MKSNKYIWFSLFLTYIQFHILHPKLYTFGLYSESKCISDSGEESERTDIPSLTDLCSCQTEELVPRGAPWDMAEPRWFQADPLSHSLCIHTEAGMWLIQGQHSKSNNLQSPPGHGGSNFYLRMKISGNSIKSKLTLQRTCVQTTGRVLFTFTPERNNRKLQKPMSTSSHTEHRLSVAKATWALGWLLMREQELQP